MRVSTFPKHTNLWLAEMPHLEFFVVSEEVSVDQATNRASVFSILEQIKSQHFPVIIGKCVAVSLWQRQQGEEDRDFQATLEIILPNNQTHQLQTNFRLTRARHRIINRIQGLPITGPGELRFNISVNGVHAATHVVSVENAAAEIPNAPGVTH